MCENCGGRIITEKPIHKSSLLSALANIWCNPAGFRVEEVAEKTFQFFFVDECDGSFVTHG